MNWILTFRFPTPHSRFFMSLNAVIIGVGHRVLTYASLLVRLSRGSALFGLVKNVSPCGRGGKSAGRQVGKSGYTHLSTCLFAYCLVLP